MSSSSYSSPSSWRTWVLSVKAIFISIGIISIAILMKHSVPLVINFLVTQLPLLWACVLSWLRPPYLYILINAIIISIAASSKFNHAREGLQEMRMDCPGEIEQPLIGGMVLKEEEKKSCVAVEDNEEDEGNEEKEEKVEKEEEAEAEEEEEFVISKSNLMMMETKMDSSEKPLVTSRFVHRRSVKASPEGGRTLGVNRPKRHETLETTWKAITEGRPMPLTRHLKKSETWENHNPQAENSPNRPNRTVRKSETFKDRTNEMMVLSPSSATTPSPGKVRKEPSLSQDELNRRVEAFIKKFNEEMRLQRQESLNQYMEMMNRGL